MIIKSILQSARVRLLESVNDDDDDEATSASSSDDFLLFILELIDFIDLYITVMD